MDYSSFLSVESSSRKPSPLKALNLKYFSQPGQISFGGGLPHPSTFPVNEATYFFPYAGQTVTVDGNGPSSAAESTATRGSDNKNLFIPLASVMQYSGSGGPANLLAFLKEHMQRYANPPYADWDVICTVGNTDAMDAILRMLGDRGDNVLVENFCYPGTLSGLVPMGLEPIPVALDAEGMVPGDMDRVLNEWDSIKQGKKPQFVLIVPSGQNPSGTTMQAARRKEFYAVAQKHNLIIVSDDPYRALVLSHESATPVEAAPSFLSLDVDGRVLDISSFSKVVAPGCRTGWVTGPKPLIERILRRNEVTTQAVSGFSQSAITSFLGALGGQDGWDKYLAHVAKQYTTRESNMNRLFSQYLPKEYCEWVRPASGMFIFVRVKAEKHPLLAELGPDGVLEHAFEACIAAKVITVPSTMFKAAPEVDSKPENVFLRCSFSYNTPEEMEEGAKRFGAGLRQSFEGSSTKA